MDYLVICISALIASGLTLFSGFGLGTLLLPVFAIFFPVDVAVALTAIVHLLNNLFKLLLLGKHAEKRVALKFGVPALLAAFLGAFAGSRLVRKVTMRSVQILVSIMLIGISIGLGAGLI